MTGKTRKGQRRNETQAGHAGRREGNQEPVGGEYILWMRESPQLKRDMTIYPQARTPEQKQRLKQIEQELLEMAYGASEETRTVLKGK